jgi:hypothetical protein
MGRNLFLAVALALVVAAPALAAPPAEQKGVSASFTYSPPTPFAGDVVVFSSNAVATGTNNRVVLEQWDLDADGSFDDDAGRTAALSFPAAGAYAVSLRAFDRDSNSDVTSQTVTVSDRPLSPPPPAPPPAPPSVISPFPVVRLSGTISARGTRVRRFTVDAPPSVTIAILCRGRGCPLRRQTRSAPVSAEAASVTWLRRFRHRLLRVGVVLKVFVTRPGSIGKYTRFRIRRGRLPARLDRCVMSSTTEPVPCPAP